jgi:hypothetical protein
MRRSQRILSIITLERSNIGGAASGWFPPAIFSKPDYLAGYCSVFGVTEVHGLFDRLANAQCAQVMSRLSSLDRSIEEILMSLTCWLKTFAAELITDLYTAYMGSFSQRAISLCTFRHSHCSTTQFFVPGAGPSNRSFRAKATSCD